METLSALIIVAAVSATMCHAETTIELNGHLPREAQSLVVFVPMSLSDGQAELSFDLTLPPNQKGSISFDFQDPALNFLYRANHSGLDIAVTELEHQNYLVRMTVSFDATDALERISSNSTVVNSLEPCLDQAVVSEWSPKSHNVEAGLAFTQASVVSCADPQGGRRNISLSRWGIGTRVTL